MVTLKDNKAMRSAVTTRNARLITDIALLLWFARIGRLGAITNGAGKRLLA